MTDEEIADAVQRAMTVHEQDQCSRQFHDYFEWPDGLRRCRCGAAHPDDYAQALHDDHPERP